ncbi:hypothetical protein [Xanthomonas campestris]|uniref:hypothetical protein n=1 Tax=Xanthomonas campestris TaxID=339 RepID=UPI0011C047C9|nr:hypothetical protein [Xanthomonas campestris]
MAVYFVCPGEVAAMNSTTVQCTVALTSIDPAMFRSGFTQQEVEILLYGTLKGVAMILAFWLIKKALDI